MQPSGLPAPKNVFASLAKILKIWTKMSVTNSFQWNVTIKECKQLFECQHLLLFRDIWWSKFLSIFKFSAFFQHQS